ncbi:hypothetical protein BD289DRAFT_485936 [Coniella lustricola]|uniref:Uncharacterized protein n=1 Tax=Coniella lustricola TaxID=2025994 RepID=A0A2T2ZWV7_9PEZI|nr:hypothetical protein BD289DRAFT_485936 [Coniella lustricola]
MSRSSPRRAVAKTATKPTTTTTTTTTTAHKKKTATTTKLVITHHSHSHSNRRRASSSASSSPPASPTKRQTICISRERLAHLRAWRASSAAQLGITVEELQRRQHGDLQLASDGENQQQQQHQQPQPQQQKQGSKRVVLTLRLGSRCSRSDAVWPSLPMSGMA